MVSRVFAGTPPSGLATLGSKLDWDVNERLIDRK